MEVFMVKHFCFLVAITLFFMACSGLGGNWAREQDEGTVKLYLGKLQVPLFDSISVLVSAADIDDIRISTKSIGDNIKVDGIPLGEDRKFEVTVYADGGKAVQKGEATVNIIANRTATVIPITLTALYGFLKIEIPLGLANSNDIHSGILSLGGGLKYQMQIENGKGIFNTGALPLDQTFNLRLELYGSNGKLLFFGEKQITLSSSLQTETIQLESNNGSAILELEMSSIEPMQIFAILPTSRSRVPENYGDLFFTEIFADPKTSGDNFEYLEIYNATLDTLKLSHCHIKHATSLKLNMPENLILPPMEYLFFGRDSVADADFNYQSFKLNNSGANLDLGFYCGSLVIDSLRYSSPFPLQRGTAMQLPISNYANRIDGTSWCLGFSPKQDASCP
jgi:hypothetical protein